ncbi:glycosyltransferase [Vibrio sp. SS-MA-C1-2]|uniref:glycosyltransferase n=1 Tax=Vibrio sp. SS-MA-C1-2 TaxID=2908646 RepID=UPI001F207B72|nr:glycosyltransferase [Vibrio sp. SS-MA-C1-2]UJF18228.1 glycosyltransferase [Vibrio sp. SS-MA-C1-2]
MKRVAIFCHNLLENGTVKAALTQADLLSNFGCDVHLFLFEDRGLFSIPSNVNVHYLNFIKKESTSSKVDKLKKEIEFFEKSIGTFDLFLCNSTDCDLIVSHCELTNVYFFCHCALKEEFIMEAKRGPVHLYRKIKKIHALRDKKLITVSKGLEKELTGYKWLKSKSIQTIYNPLDIDLIHKRMIIENPVIPTEPYMIYIGRVTKQKRLDVLFKAIKSMKNNLKLVILTNNNKKAFTLAKKYNVEERVILPGFQDNPYNWIANAELMLLSSDFEGFGLVIAESLICGTPVISTDCPYGPSELLINNQKNFLVSVGDYNMLAKKTDECLLKPPLINLDDLNMFRGDVIVEQYLKLMD